MFGDQFVSAYPKVLVVDDGARSGDGAVSAELAELGYASVTASFEAVDDVLALLPSPAAIVLQLPRESARVARSSFVALAERLKAAKRTALVPLIFLDGHSGSSRASFGLSFAEHIRSRPLNEAEL